MPKIVALARRWPNGDGGRWQLYTARGWKLAVGVTPLGGSFARIPAKAGTPASAISSRWQLYLAEFTQEEIAEKVGMHRSVVSRDLQSARDVCRSGDSPDLEVARFIQTAVRRRGQAFYTLYEVEARYTTSGSQSPFPVSHCVPRRRPHPGKTGRSTTRWLMDTAPIEVVIRYAK
jgi:hypothetical protein